MKRIKLLSILPILLLSSCGELKPYGTYQFRLGKTNDSHLEVTAVLTKEDHPDFEGMKKMSLSADLGEDMSFSSVLESYVDKYPILEPFVTFIEKEFADVKEVDLFYKVLDIKNSYGHRLAIGTDMLVPYLEKIRAEYPEISNLLDALGFTDEDVILKPDTTKYFFNAYLNGKTLDFQLPVSFDDLEMQLFWYGKGNSRVGDDYMDQMPGVKGEERFGTHPTIKKDITGKLLYSDVDTINKTFEKEFSNTFLYQDSTKIGSFVTSVVDGKTQLRLFLEGTYEGSREHIVGNVITKNIMGEFEEEKDIQISVNEENVVNIIHNGESGRKEGFTDEAGHEFTFANLIQDPYTFRDFHNVNVGLQKQ